MNQSQNIRAGSIRSFTSTPGPVIPADIPLEKGSTIQTNKNRRLQFSLVTLLFGTCVLAFVATWIRPYLLPPPKWQEFSIIELQRELDRGRPVVVYFRDDWWLGFDQLETELLTKELAVSLRKNDAVMMIADRTLRNAQAETELRRISGSNLLPAVAIYSPKKSAMLLEQPIEAASLIRVLNKTTK